MIRFLKNKKNYLYAVADGEIIPIEKVNDQVFSKKTMGDGVGINFTNNLICSPADGVITMIFPTLHAFGIKCENGLEVLVHIGIDTVALNGKGFKKLVNVNTKIKRGTPIIEVDRDYLLTNKYEMVVLVIVTNHQGEKLHFIDKGYVKSRKTVIMEIDNDKGVNK